VTTRTVLTVHTDEQAGKYYRHALYRHVRGRRELGALPMRRCEALDFEQPSVFGVLHHRDDDAVLMPANLGADEVELLADGDYEPASTGAIGLNGYGYRWLVCTSPRVAGKPDL
jgi:hypothetical protein